MTPWTLMILIDTNIISELMKPNIDSAVKLWVDSQPSDQMFISTVTIAEISFGINILPIGKRRKVLETLFFKTILEAFEERILPFDESAAHIYGRIMAHRRKLGHPLSLSDGQIAAIAHQHHATIATRNIKDFCDCGLELVNPFG